MCIHNMYIYIYITTTEPSLEANPAKTEEPMANLVISLSLSL